MTNSSSSVILDNALLAYQQGRRSEAAALIETFCSFCVSKGRHQKCDKCGLQRALNILQGVKNND